MSITVVLLACRPEAANYEMLLKFNLMEKMDLFLKRKNKRIVFRTRITEWESFETLYFSNEIIDIKKDDKITLKGKGYEVSYIDWNFDKKEVEVVVWEI